MDTYESLFSAGGVLNEQISRQLFHILPEENVIIVMMDRDGNCRPSDSERFSRLGLSDSFLKELCAKIDDGQEPVVTQTRDVSIVASQLSAEQNECGYVIILLPQYNPESTLANMDLIEIILSQMNLIAKLIEKNNQLHERQMKQLSAYSGSGASSN